MTKILLVDDDPDFTLVCRTILEDEGYEVEEAANGSIALQKIREAPPNLILLDVMMSSPLEGVDVSRSLQADPDLCQIPVVMVSSIATTEYASDFPEGERIPIEAWISKPVQPAILLRTVKRFVG